MQNITTINENAGNWLEYGNREEINSYCVLNLILSFFGIIGNSVCIYVFVQKQMITRKQNWYLLAIAIFELIFCLVIFSDYMCQTIHEERFFLHELNKYSETTMNFLIHATDMYLVVLTLFLSIDRLYAIKNPFTIKSFVTNEHTKMVIAISLIFVLCLETLNDALCILFENTVFYTAFCIFISPLLLSILPNIMILVLNSLLIKHIIHYYKNRSLEYYKFLASREVSLYRQSICKELTFRECKKNSKSELLVLTHKFNDNLISGTQRSHYFVIIILAVWLVLTSIPYHTVNSFYLLIYFKDIAKTKIKYTAIVKIQVIASIFFNSNHCINILVYLRFYPAFRCCVSDILKKKIIF